MLSDCWNPNSHSTPNPKVDLLEKLLLTQMVKLNCQLASNLGDGPLGMLVWAYSN